VTYICAVQLSVLEQNLEKAEQGEDELEIEVRYWVHTRWLSSSLAGSHSHSLALILTRWLSFSRIGSHSHSLAHILTHWLLSLLTSPHCTRWLSFSLTGSYPYSLALIALTGSYPYSLALILTHWLLSLLTGSRSISIAAHFLIVRTLRAVSADQWLAGGS
jgi:hypothetical protein